MNDDQFEALDNRASQAASNVKAAAAQRSRPTFDADRPMTLPAPVAVGQSRAPRRTAWVAAAAVVALVAGAITFAATRPDDGKDTIAAAAVEEPRPFVADVVPDGFQPAAFTSLGRTAGGAGEEGPFESSMPIYGKSVDEPLVGAALVDSEGHADLDLEPVDVEGLTLYRPSNDPLPGTWVILKQGESTVLVFGATEADAVTLAQLVTVVDNTVSVEVGALPDGWRRLVTVEDPMMLMSKSPSASTSSMGYFATYMKELSGDLDYQNFANFQVTSLAGDEATMWAGRLFFPDAREVTVRGHRGFVGVYSTVTDDSGDSAFPDMKTVSWLERPGEILSVTGGNVSEEQLLAIAEDLRPVLKDEWSKLTEQAQLGEFEGNMGGFDQQLGRITGTFDDGTSWSLAVRQSEPGRIGGESSEGDSLPDDELAEGGVYTDLRVAVANDQSTGAAFPSSSSGSSGASGLAQAFLSVETTDVGGRYFSSGIIADDVVRVELQTADGTVLGDALIVEVAGHRAFVTELTEDPTVLVALLADGSEVGRVTVEELADNVTVSMDGDGSFAEQGTEVDAEGNPVIDPVQPSPTTVVSGD